MKFKIERADIVYGGGPGPAEFHVIESGVSYDFVRGYFRGIKLDSNLSTFPDSMGCHSKYRITVEALE